MIFRIQKVLLLVDFLTLYNVIIPDYVNVVGHGDMAVANSFGACIFTLLFCLGLPWFVGYFLHSKANIIESSFTFEGICLTFTSIVPVILFKVNSWKLDNRVGTVLIILYCIFIILVGYEELHGQMIQTKIETIIQTYRGV